MVTGPFACAASIPLKLAGNDAIAEFTLAAGQSADFILEEAQEEPGGKEKPGGKGEPNGKGDLLDFVTQSHDKDCQLLERLGGPLHL